MGGYGLLLHFVTNSGCLRFLKALHGAVCYNLLQYNTMTSIGSRSYSETRCVIAIGVL